jgi:protein O-GlcNAc transferase
LVTPIFKRSNGAKEAARRVAEVVKQACAVLPGDAGRESTAHLAEAVARFLPDANLATHVGFALHLEGELRAAVAAYRRAVNLDATRFDAWYALGCAELDRDSHTEAIRCFHHALALRPTHARAHFDLGRALFGAGEVDAALDSLRIAANDPSELRREALARIARYIPGSPRADNAAVLAARRAWAALETVAEGSFRPFRHDAASSGRKLRIGYVSAFFGKANWMKPVWGVINNHDRSQLEIHLFSDSEPPTKECGYSPHPRDRFVDARGLSNRELALAVAELGIDVLVDLNGYSFQSRFGVFIRRPAPLIVGWFNMYATTGVEAFDCIVGDDVVIPRQEERFYSERVVRVPGSYIAFSVLYQVPEIVPPPCAATGQLTFGSFASQYKLTDEVIAAWATILNRSPASRLLIKNRTLSDASNRAALHDRFQRHGVLSERVLLEGPEEHYQFLAAYARVDITLDTFPYNGGTTTTESLWAGVPVLTFNGDRWVSRISCSLLLAAGLDIWCMPDLNAYICRAVTLAGSPTVRDELAALRETMRARLLATAACDSAGLSRALEDLYRSEVRRRFNNM